MATVITIKERKLCISDMPAALMAVSSELSPRLPKVISELSNIANGRACGTIIRPMYWKNCASTSIDRPLPMSSSMKRHKNCIISTKRQMKNVPAKSSKNCLAMNLSSFFIRRSIIICAKIMRIFQTLKFSSA